MADVVCGVERDDEELLLLDELPADERLAAGVEDFGVVDFDDVVAVLAAVVEDVLALGVDEVDLGDVVDVVVVFDVVDLGGVYSASSTPILDHTVTVSVPTAPVADTWPSPMSPVRTQVSIPALAQTSPTRKP